MTYTTKRNCCAHRRYSIPTNTLCVASYFHRLWAFSFLLGIINTVILVSGAIALTHIHTHTRMRYAEAFYQLVQEIVTIQFHAGRCHLY